MIAMTLTYVNMCLVKTIATIAACCPPLLAEPLSAEDAEQLATPIKALADPARLRLLA